MDVRGEDCLASRKGGSLIKVLKIDDLLVNKRLDVVPTGAVFAPIAPAAW